MRWLLLVLVLLALVGFFLLKRRNRSHPEGTDNLPYVLGDGLFSVAERSFLGVLDQAVGTDFRVFGKVRVADVLAVAKGTPNHFGNAHSTRSAQNTLILSCAGLMTSNPSA